MKTLEELRKDRGMSVYALLDELDQRGCKTTPTSYQRWADGTSYPSGPCALALCQALRVSPEELQEILKPNK